MMRVMGIKIKNNMRYLKKFDFYIIENVEQLSLKYIRPDVTDDMGWRKPGMADWGVFKNDELVAVFYLDDEKPDLYIRGFEIKEDFRGKGYGKKVLDLIKSYAKSKKFKFLTLNFYKSNKVAEHLYRSYGFFDDTKQFPESPVINLRMKI
jgi:GNAT superfamily N-acetyltransferase